MWRRGWGELMSSLGMNGDTARRAAECLLQSTGRLSVFLRIPAPAVASSVEEQLGLATPEFQDAELSPVVFRKLCPQLTKYGARWELMVSAIAVNRLVGLTGATDGNAAFAGAAGVLIGESLMEILSVSSSDVAGSPVVYRVVLGVPAAESI